MSRPAFSLLEIIAVIGILAVLLAIATPGVQSYRSTLALQAEARRLTGDLRTAQELTVSEQIVHYLEATPGTSAYRLYRADATPTLLMTVTFDPTVTIVEVTGPADGTFRYNSYGAVSTAGTIVLQNQQGNRRTVRIRPSGYVRIE